MIAKDKRNIYSKFELVLHHWVKMNDEDVISRFGWWMKKMDGDHNIHHLANELCYNFLLGAPKLNFFALDSLLLHNCMESLCGICWKLASTRLGIATKYPINFVIIILCIFFFTTNYFVMHLINYQTTSKHIDDFMNQFLITFYFLYTTCILHHMCTWQRTLELQTNSKFHKNVKLHNFNSLNVF
jgi:hypothetical protein